MPDRSEMLLLMLIIMANPAVYADEGTSAEMPSIEFLEFLGEWETDSGEWIAPDELEDRTYAGLGRTDDSEQEDE
jgi:hypothetical protein